MSLKKNIVYIQYILGLSHFVSLSVTVKCKIPPSPTLSFNLLKYIKIYG